ncbi:hypothetical protein PMAYCL1PPCAC_26569, partial [Pristionchus mayeri]
ERQLTDSALQQFPSKKFLFAPFFCTKCHSAHKSMEDWAEHNQKNTLNGHPCNGELRVMKRVVENGRPTFRGNVPPQKVGGACGQVSSPSKTRRSHGSRLSQSGNAQVKNEPIDPDDLHVIDQTSAVNGERNRNSFDARAGARAESIPDDPTTSEAEAVDGPEVVEVKEEPLDEEEELHSPSTSTTSAAAAASREEKRVKEELVGLDDEEDQGGSGDPREGVREADEESSTFDCEICDGVFHDSTTYVAHMAEAHGYVLAEEEGLDEEQIARIEAGENPGPPVAKKPKMEEEEDSPSPTPCYPPLTVLSNPADSWFKCQQCPEYCETIEEYAEHAKCHRGTQMLAPGYACKVCHGRSFQTVEERKKHELECRTLRLSQTRDRALLRHCVCCYCKLSMPNAYVLLHHIMAEHMDTVEKLRKNYLMASEFLPFRCTACNVGFEDPRLLLNHFRLREEFGIACTGNYALHAYTESLIAAEVKAATDLAQKIPRLRINDDAKDDDVRSSEWCPRDPIPSNNIELTGKVQCPVCPEMWPNVQLKMHVKMEHPKMYFDYASLQCKICKKYGFWSASVYADHFQSCKSASQLGVFDLRDIAVAPRIERSTEVPPAGICKLPGIPEDMGNEMRQCRFCAQSFTPAGLLMHQKTDHPIHHFTDAPYHCMQCGDVGFYSHEAFKKHTQVCTGKMPDELVNDIFAITTLEIQTRTSVRRLEVPCYHVLIEEDRRKFGTLAALNRPLKCSECESWCSSLATLGEHLEHAHAHRKLHLICSGCAATFSGKQAVSGLEQHLASENAKGNTRCFDTAMLNSEGLFKTPPPAQMYDLNQFMRHERPATMVQHQPDMPQQGQADETPRRNHQPRVGGFKNLARQEAFERRNCPPRPVGQLLPIRPISVMSKSPLSGERRAFDRERVAAAIASSSRKYGTRRASLPEANAYYKEVAARERQREIMRVDLTAPLSIPKRLTPNDARFLKPIATPVQPRSSILYQPYSGAVQSRADRPRLRDVAEPGRPYAIQAPARASPAGTMHTSRPVSFGGGIRPENKMHSLATSSVRSMRVGDRSTFASPMGRLGRPQISGFSQPREPIPPPPRLDPMVQKHNREPKQEPDF